MTPAAKRPPRTPATTTATTATTAKGNFFSGGALGARTTPLPATV